VNNTAIRALFVAAGLYDGILGLAFVFFPAAIFAHYGVTPPNHYAYVQFPALLLIVFAAMFFRIATDPVRHRELILYGCGLKAAYCGLASWHRLHEQGEIHNSIAEKVLAREKAAWEEQKQREIASLKAEAAAAAPPGARGCTLAP
jgi:hypothetical protein